MSICKFLHVRNVNPRKKEREVTLILFSKLGLLSFISGVKCQI